MRKDKGLLPALILTIICIVATALLAFTNQITMTKRIEQEIAAENENRLALFLEADKFEEIDVTPYISDLPDITSAHNVYNADGEKLGMLFTAAARGYGGSVPIMAAINSENILSGIRVLANEETPGLGKKVEEEEFLQQFAANSTDIRYSTKIGDSGRQVIDSVSGATISSRAVTEGLNEGLDLYSKIGGEDS